MANLALPDPPKAPEPETATQSSAASISDPPAADQTVLHENRTYTTIKEGLAYILIPPDAPLSQNPEPPKGEVGPVQSVFYNPIQQYNRDLTVLAIRAFGEDHVAEKLAKFEQGQGKREKKAARNKGKQVKGTEAQGTTKRKLADTAPEDSQEPAVKRSKADRNSISDLLEDDDLMDEDLLACESAILSQATPGQPAQEDTVEEPKKFKPSFRVLDALSATGLRALRYAQELPFITTVTANDLSPKAVQMIALNIKHNKLEGKIETTTGNANAHMYSLVGQEGKGGPGTKYDVIDIDPYGTAVPFLDAAIQALANGGLLCVTCTDSGVFNSIGYSEKTFSLYGGLPMKGEHCHEAGLRLILHAIATSAAKYGISIEPLLSLSIDYYARVFVRVKRSPAEVKFHSSKTMLVYSCDHGCGAWQTQFLGRASPQTSKNGQVSYKHGAAQGPTASPLCEHCGSKMHIAGPMYGGPLHNPSFIDKMLNLLPSLDKETYKTVDRIEGMLETAYDEMQMFNKEELFAKSKAKAKTNNNFDRLNEVTIDHHPFYVIPSALSRIIHCQAPSDAQLRGAFRHMGYKAVRSHAKPGSIKTDAPWSVIWDIMREWVRQKSPLKEGSLKDGMPGYRIMQNGALKQKEIPASESDPKDADAENPSAQPRIIFDEALGAEKQTKRLLRYQMNPRANWGPMSRAK